MAAHISHCSHSTSRTIFPPFQNSHLRRLLGRNPAKILYKTDETSRNRVIDFHHLQANTSVCSSKPVSAIIQERKSNINNAAKTILKPKSSLKYKPKGEEKNEDLEYYKPKKGDIVVGVVNSCKNNKLEISIGAKSLASMHLSNFLPNNQSETAQISCELPADINIEGISESSSSYSSAVNDCCERFANGRMGVLMNEIAAKKSVIEEGTVIYAEVLGRTLNGEVQLSSELCARKIARHRVRQIRHINKPIEIVISEWNTGGLLSQIEGLRVFLPKCEILNTPLDDFSVLKEYVGKRMEVVIIDVYKEPDQVVVSEKGVWATRNLYEGTVLQGTIKTLNHHGAQVMVNGIGLSGPLHISDMSRKRILSVTDLFSVGERVKVMVRFRSPNKLYFSTATLESEDGLILSNKERVFEEAEQVAAAYRRKLGYKRKMQTSVDDLDISDIYDNTNKCYANWDWFTN